MKLEQKSPISNENRRIKRICQDKPDAPASIYEPEYSAQMVKVQNGQRSPSLTFPVINSLSKHMSSSSVLKYLSLRSFEVVCVSKLFSLHS